MTATQTIESLRAQIGHRVPALFATAPAAEVSDRYQFIATTDYVQALLERGWTVTEARQTGTSLTGLHSVTMIHPDAPATRADLGLLRPRMLLTTAHNGTRALRAAVGLFRVVCSNGLVVATGPAVKTRIRHVGDVGSAADLLSQEFFGNLESHLAVAEKWAATPLDPQERSDLARAAWALREEPEEGDQPLSPWRVDHLLRPRRDADRGLDLWRTYNVLQERITYGVRAIDRNLKLNQGLWQLAADLHARRN